MQEIRRQARSTSLARAQVTTLREQLFNSPPIEESVRRIVVHLPQFSLATEWTASPANSAPHPADSPPLNPLTRLNSARRQLALTRLTNHHTQLTTNSTIIPFPGLLAQVPTTIAYTHATNNPSLLLLIPLHE